MNRQNAPRVKVVVLATATAITVLVAVALPAVGLFLVIADPLERSDAIFVLDGGTPARELEAAALYHRGYAPLVVVTLARDSLSREVRQLSGQLLPQQQAAKVLRHVGVPPDAIVLLPRMIENTAEELVVDHDFARSRGFRRVILVTSPFHTRRVRLMWAGRFGRTMPAIVRPTPWERIAPERWWRSRRYLEMTAHEVFGLLNFYLGSPIRTFDREG